jgi:hypothetical protein
MRPWTDCRVPKKNPTWTTRHPWMAHVGMPTLSGLRTETGDETRLSQGEGKSPLAQCMASGVGVLHRLDQKNQPGMSGSPGPPVLIPSPPAVPPVPPEHPPQSSASTASVHSSSHFT